MIPRRVVLIGFMASGKTEVGARLAARIGWRHIDVDALIVEHACMTIEEIFSTSGEVAFRRMEARLSRDLVNEDGVVITPGGGWVTNRGLFESLPEDTLTVWLKVSPTEVLRRIEGNVDQPVRPMLGSQRADRIKELLELREPLYQQAQITIETDGRSIADIVDRIEDEIKCHTRSGSTQPRENDQ